MFTTSRDVQEWYLPSWRIEPKYSTKVLIGNWLEERKKYIRDHGEVGKSIYRRDYVRFPGEVPDRTMMRKYMKKLDGLPKQYLLTHHGEPSHRNLVTQYDDQYIRHGYNPLLPPLRKWSRHKMAWLPERSDYPVAEPPTNYGLFEHLVKKWSHRDPEVMNSVYTISYVKPPVTAYPERRRPITTRVFKSTQKQWVPRSLDPYL
ncbi:cilia- and flagella-associated protein 107 [Hemicordylus capensis]|uniref:cilia- and flagella-associated protein 107 n=1 Tax=Hemicordylus capensis TaxID=884348 RepID=UPI0023024C0C|nr:cilia- and flagella-associated protein 107 [Hemicordylus capensis]